MITLTRSYLEASTVVVGEGSLFLWFTEKSGGSGGRGMNRGGLAVKSGLRGQRVPCLKPGSIEDPPCMWICRKLNHMKEPSFFTLVRCGSLDRWCQLRVVLVTGSPCPVQNYEVRPKVDLVLPQNGR
ncbi:hypothetical protein AVEN_211908-1 [Araneus ventricosus]|uniref:Uncharacterized protein n=1 Tax=Araneus ventricosus TaxID=182803 RepID=A0A4Y2R2B8_ARAVE|nr:hypothetical protein AVEN_211908-1 [Araneus ventricosus]